MTGVQALERKHSGLPMSPGKVERQEFEYIRHGTLSFIVNFEVATGQVATVSCGCSRNEEDFVQHIQRIVECSPQIAKWHFVVDNLNTHQSESLVRYVADESDLAIDLGIKGKSGILQSMETRTAFLQTNVAFWIWTLRVSLVLDAKFPVKCQLPIHDAVERRNPTTHPFGLCSTTRQSMPPG